MLRLDEVTKTYQKNGSAVHALDGVSLEAAPGEFILIKGPSGCGKSTLLLSAGGMLRPAPGRVFLDGQDVYALSGAKRNRLRAAKVGFVFQTLHLIPYLTVRENILLGGLSGADGLEERLEPLVEALGLAHRANHRPGELSVGERQRAALARAFIGRPPLILADEPTGNLDPDNARRVMEHLDAYRRDGATVLVATHGDAAEAFASRALTLRDGRLQPQGGAANA
jgi:putative ABC transport system ATP-binding protein